MGIFDKKSKGKKGEDFDSPVEQIDLDAVRAKAHDEEDEREERLTTQDIVPEVIEDEVDIAAEAEPAPEPPRKHQDYGIEEAIALMRTLPMDNVELVVRVVKHTLESTHIDIPLIIEDATGKQERIANRIQVLKEEISDLEKEIAKRSDEIQTLEKDNEETTLVKERLELAEKLGKTPGRDHRASVPPPAASEKSSPVFAAKK